MQKLYHSIKDPIGIHVRPAGGLVKIALQFESKIDIYCGDHHADGKHLLSILSLKAKAGDGMCVCVSGPDEQEAARALAGYLKDA